MLTYAVIAVRHLLSSDSNFASVGAVSSISYQEQWCDHMLGLISTWHSLPFQETREWLDDIVFEGTPERRSKSSTSSTAPPGVITRMDPRLLAARNVSSGDDFQHDIDENIPCANDGLPRINDDLPRVEDNLPRVLPRVNDPISGAPIIPTTPVTSAASAASTVPIVPVAPIVSVAGSSEGPTMPVTIAAPVHSRALSANRSHRPSPTSSALPSSSNSPSLAPNQLPVASQPPARHTVDALAITLSQIMIDCAAASGSDLPMTIELAGDYLEPTILASLPSRARV
ncbi:hypothetical protein C8Q73DRAFT_796096 [Cubamyces lactineus]|nr:hypothetical protein C8Q73DRAFT_796096 [Cubamyces lactineus]